MTNILTLCFVKQFFLTDSKVLFNVKRVIKLVKN